MNKLTCGDCPWIDRAASLSNRRVCCGLMGMFVPITGKECRHRRAFRVLRDYVRDPVCANGCQKRIKAELAQAREEVKRLQDDLVDVLNEACNGQDIKSLDVIEQLVSEALAVGDDK